MQPSCWLVSTLLLTEKSVFFSSLGFVLSLRWHDLFTACSADGRAGLRAAIPALKRKW